MSTIAAHTVRTERAPGLLGLGGLRLTARGRRVLVVLALLVAAAASVAWGSQAIAGGPGQPVEVRLQTVAPGDSLWRYAAMLAEPGQDVRDVVVELKALNGMRTAELRVGQVIVLPSS